MTINVADETLMALADEALPSDEAMRVRALIATSPDLAERYSRFVESRFLLEDMGEAPQVTSLGPLRKAERPPRRLSMRGRHSAPLALAASVALIVGLTGGVLLDRFTQTGKTTERVEASASAQAHAAIAKALNEAPSGAVIAFGQTGESGAGRIAMISSHRLSNGVVCRQYEVSLDRLDALPETLLSCMEDKGVWRKRVVVFGEEHNAYATASSAANFAPLVEAIGGGANLSPAEEAAALQR